MRFFWGFVFGIIVSYIFLDHDIHFFQRLGNAIDWQELQRLAGDVVR